MAKTYSATDIQVLEGLDAVRMRPGMYIGSTGPRGLHHLIWEIVDNAIDEASNGYATEISVALKKDGSCEVTDNGRGIPVDIHPQLGVSGVEVVYTQLHAGGKFNNKNYAYSGGLHGVGASVVNALSEWVTVDVYRDYSHYQIRFESVEDKKTGKIISGRPVAPLEKVGNTRKRGTQVCFKPDPRVFEDTHFNGDIVRRRVRELAYLNKGVRFVFIDEREKDEERRRREYCYEGGLADFVRYLNTDKNAITEPITFEGRRDGTLLRVAIQYTDSYTENIYSFVNNVPTGEGGTHETGFKAAVTKAFNDYARRVGLLKEKDNNLSGEDFREGMTAVVYAGVQKPQFEGQTKGRLGNTEVRPIVEAICLEQLSIFLDDLKNQEVAQHIVEKAVKAAKVREATRKARDVARQKNQLEAAPLVGKLSSCTGRNWKENELFIVEGDSAGGSAKQGRDRRFQAILPLRGKPLNAEKKRIDQVLANEEFRSIITALGTGIGEDFDLSHLKYNRVIILSDADQDGAHIRAILLTFFFRYMRELVTDGHVYIGMPPLYCARKGEQHIYCFDDKELARATKKLGRGYSVQRYKGLGEMNPEQLWETTMNPNGRKMVQVTIDDLAEADRRVTVLMGDKVDPRREYIQYYANFNHEDNFEPVGEGE
ncbi:MAG TPA: type IIA DNA topoisomerase subunit B [Candidatus Pullichristensenella stercorigallinarum]|uniref:DNA topoisomerase (ATP-hydrolyzing) n=1 Tax=Candidatus Pullichristensenella stercorigallinarum TaxID=2840909 RepID=A0A9D0ZMK9_9FIRM|nr:type IIA DNA topoisomerase subunit B [Candidatus Pullichristensenella stercorigallinarum]